MVKVREELKSARIAVKMLEETLEREKERSRAREQEAFTARYQIVGVQEQLDKALERVMVVEQERDAFKTAAKNEEVARIAAEGRLPLPLSEDPNDEFASPRKATAGAKEPRVSLSTMEILSSAASEMEIEELTTQLVWERQRADRAQEMVEFLQAECKMHCCPCSKTATTATTRGRASLSPPQKRRRESSECRVDDEEPSAPRVVEPERPPAGVKSKKEPRRSTIFCPREGIFRTVSEQEAAALEAAEMEARRVEDETAAAAPHVVDTEPMDTEADVRMYARTPSADPPAFALLSNDRTSLQSLLNAPHGGHLSAEPPAGPGRDDDGGGNGRAPAAAPAPPRPHTSAKAYTVTTTVPVRDERASSSSSFSERLRTPSGGSDASFDHTNPALTPTMTREEALAKIRERRGRVRSAQAAAAAPPKASRAPDRRGVSAPTAAKARPRSGAL